MNIEKIRHNMATWHLQALRQKQLAQLAPREELRSDVNLLLKLGVAFAHHNMSAHDHTAMLHSP